MLCQNLVTRICAGVDWKVVGKYCDVSRSYKTFQNPNDESTSAPKTWRATFLHLLTLPGIIPQSVVKLPGKLWRTVSGREKDMKLGKNFREGACFSFYIQPFIFIVRLVALKWLQHACMNGCSSTSFFFFFFFFFSCAATFHVTTSRHAQRQHLLLPISCIQIAQSGSEELQTLPLWLAGSDWGHDPERYFGHVTVRVDPGEEEEEETPFSRSGPADRDLDDDDYDDDNISGVSGSYEDNDEVPFGPSRAVPGEGKGQSKSLEIFRRAASHASYPDVDIEQGTRCHHADQACMLCFSNNNLFIVHDLLHCTKR